MSQYTRCVLCCLAAPPNCCAVYCLDTPGALSVFTPCAALAPSLLCKYPASFPLDDCFNRCTPCVCACCCCLHTLCISSTPLSNKKHSCGLTSRSMCTTASPQACGPWCGRHCCGHHQHKRQHNNSISQQQQQQQEVVQQMPAQQAPCLTTTTSSSTSSSTPAGGAGLRVVEECSTNS